ncbi:phage baseplate assembly protein V [Comamonas antarctica]|uniref:Phage baseplate assembly protein V n=1 Tax=Comamonas antarctica TaxID=2743470 RepID=A0A6N1WZE8_9BURK|nr:phage baseplate assembly protein V [Comamonas antarctica]QKV52387.1 phage baseplate assembly protein V [Comamonas antarctica]
MSTPDPILVLSELQRLVHNLIRVGSIHSVDHGGPGKPARVRVQIGELVTDWRPYHECRAGGTKTWNPPTAGEQATVLSPSGDLGAAVVLVGLNSTGNPAPSNDPNKTITEYPDGTVVEYDHAAHALLVTLAAGGTATLIAPGSVTVDSPEVTMTGNCTVDGSLTYKGGMRGSGKASGAGSSADIEGTLSTTQDVVANGISLAGHVHGEVLRGGDNTSSPRGAA